MTWSVLFKLCRIGDDISLNRGLHPPSTHTRHQHHSCCRLSQCAPISDRRQPTVSIITLRHASLTPPILQPETETRPVRPRLPSPACHHVVVPINGICISDDLRACIGRLCGEGWWVWRRQLRYGNGNGAGARDRAGRMVGALDVDDYSRMARASTLT